MRGEASDLNHDYATGRHCHASCGGARGRGAGGGRGLGQDGATGQGFGGHSSPLLIGRHRTLHVKCPAPERDTSRCALCGTSGGPGRMGPRTAIADAPHGGRPRAEGRASTSRRRGARCAVIVAPHRPVRQCGPVHHRPVQFADCGGGHCGGGVLHEADGWAVAQLQSRPNNSAKPFKHGSEEQHRKVRMRKCDKHAVRKRVQLMQNNAT